MEKAKLCDHGKFFGLGGFFFFDKHIGSEYQFKDLHQCGNVKGSLSCAHSHNS